jgi:hypothetical protein
MSAVQQSILNKNRKDKFLLVLNLPEILKEINKISPSDRESKYINFDSLQYSVYGAVVPTITVSDVDTAFGGQVAKFTSYNRPAYSPITVNFTIDNGFNNWWVLWSWLNLLNNSKTGKYNSDEISQPDLVRVTNSYQADITIYGLDEYNNKKIQFDYTNAFITGLGEIVYNYRESEQIESSFTFAFNQFTPKLL